MTLPDSIRYNGFEETFNNQGLLKNFHRSFTSWVSENAFRYQPDVVRDFAVVGGGLHAAIFCAGIRGPRPPLVVEATDFVGGIFAANVDSVFRLNSRNRPGERAGLPRTTAPLNVMSGTGLQPSGLSAAEYQTNAELAYCIRVLLAQSSVVVKGRKTDAIRRAPNGVLQLVNSRGKPLARKVIIATGIGRSRLIPGQEMDFRGFCRLRPEAKGRWAVIGAGDAGKCVIEYLVSPPVGIERPDRIKWYGLPIGCKTRESWLRKARPRYKLIGLNLPSGTDKLPFTVETTAERGIEILKDGDRSYVRSRGGVSGPFDNVVSCTGYDPEPELIDAPLEPVKVGDTVVAMKYKDWPVYKVGPCAQIPSEVPDGIPENTVSIWRYSERTAALAKSLCADL